MVKNLATGVLVMAVAYAALTMGVGLGAWVFGDNIIAARAGVALCMWAWLAFAAFALLNAQDGK